MRSRIHGLQDSWLLIRLSPRQVDPTRRDHEISLELSPALKGHALTTARFISFELGDATELSPKPIPRAVEAKLRIRGLDDCRLAVLFDPKHMAELRRTQSLEIMIPPDIHPRLNVVQFVDLVFPNEPEPVPSYRRVQCEPLSAPVKVLVLG